MKGDNENKMFVYGASGHAKVVIDIIERQGVYKIAFLVDDDPLLKGNYIYGYPVLGGKADLLAQRQVMSGIVAIGNNSIRTEVADWLARNGFHLLTAVHPSAQLARGVILGAGVVVTAGVVINSDTVIGNIVIVNTRASIDHDCVVKDGAHIAPGAILCGSVFVGVESFICAGATVIPNLTVGNRVVVGSGATVISNVPDAVTVVGNPARILK